MTIYFNNQIVIARFHYETIDGKIFVELLVKGCMDKIKSYLD